MVPEVISGVEKLTQERDTAIAERDAARGERDQIRQIAEPHPHQWYGRLTYSQHGEDLIFVDILHRLGIREPTYLDVGAHHPLNINNTALLHSRGATGVNVDAHPFAIEEFNRLRPRDKNLNLGVGPTRSKMTFYRYDGDTAGRSTFSKKALDDMFAMWPNMHLPTEIEIDVLPLDDLVKEHCDGMFPDLFSLDAEYLDLDILKQASFDGTRPKIICVEVGTPAGDSSPEIATVLAEKGFAPYARMGGNLIFIDRPLMPQVLGI